MLERSAFVDEMNAVENGPFQYSAKTSGAALIGPSHRSGRAGMLAGARSLGVLTARHPAGGANVSRVTSISFTSVVSRPVIQRPLIWVSVRRSTCLLESGIGIVPATWFWISSGGAGRSSAYQTRTGVLTPSWWNAKAWAGCPA